MRILACLLLIGCITAHDHEHGHGHTHSHGHSHEPAHYKYSREANEPAVHEHEHDHHDHHDHHEHEHSNDNLKSGHDHHSHSSPKKMGVEEKAIFDAHGPLSFMNDARTRLWVYSIGSTLIISIAPFIILSFIPVQANTAESEPLLKVLLSFGSGGLLGDAFLHLIPHAQPSGEHGHGHSHGHGDSSGGHSHGPHDLSVGGCVLAGIIVFLTVEKIVRIIRGEDSHSGLSHGHSHSHVPSKEKQKKSSTLRKRKKSKVSDEESCEDDKEDGDNKNESTTLVAQKHETNFRVAAYLNLVADFAHNFTDGLAIGASYLAGSTVGVVTMITVLVHEVPHEIGDFAILVQSGFSKKRAMLVQLLTALGALTGCILSLCTADAYDLDAASSSWVLPFTAGGFIYIATVSVIPELLENSSTWQSIKEITALLVGIALMYLIAMYE